MKTIEQRNQSEEQINMNKTNYNKNKKRNSINTYKVPEFIMKNLPIEKASENEE